MSSLRNVKLAIGSVIFAAQTLPGAAREFVDVERAFGDVDVAIVEKFRNLVDVCSALQ